MMKKELNLKNFQAQCMKLLFVFIISVVLVFTTVFVKEAFKKQGAKAYNIIQTKILQAKLQGLGYFNSEIDGLFDKDTKTALQNYQKDVGLTPTGILDESTMCAVGVSNNAQANNNLYLLAKLIHSEARGEVYTGQVAVGAVVLNRVDSADFPNTLEGVIYQPWAFTALHDGQFDLEPTSESYQAAEDALSGWDPTYGCLYYYNPRTATSQWIFSREIAVEIGNHVFCY